MESRKKARAVLLPADEKSIPGPDTENFIAVLIINAALAAEREWLVWLDENAGITELFRGFRAIKTAAHSQQLTDRN